MLMWARFCILFGLTSSLLAVVGLYSDAVLITYVSFLLHARKTKGDPYAWGTISEYLTAIRDWHIKHGLPNPTGRPLVRRALQTAKKFCRRLGRVERKWPISASVLRLWKTTLDLSRWNARVFYAAALLAFFGLHRVSEFAGTSYTYKGLRRGNIKFGQCVNGVPAWVTVKLEYTKTDTLWRYGGTAKYFPSGTSLCVVKALWAILEHDTRPAHAPLFVIKGPGGNAVNLHRRHVSKFVKEMAKLAGLPISKFDTHSFRAGGACALWAANYSCADIQVFGRWRSDCFRIYLCQAEDRIKDVTRKMATANADGIFYAQIHDELRVEPIPPRSLVA